MTSALNKNPTCATCGFDEEVTLMVTRVHMCGSSLNSLIAAYLCDYCGSAMSKEREHDFIGVEVIPVESAYVDNSGE